MLRHWDGLYLDFILFYSLYDIMNAKAGRKAVNFSGCVISTGFQMENNFAREITAHDLSTVFWVLPTSSMLVSFASNFLLSQQMNFSAQSKCSSIA